MLETLKKLYGEAVTEESLVRFKEELGKRFVPKADFNQRGEELKLAREKIAQQEAQMEGFQTMAQEKEDLQQALEVLDAKLKETVAAYEDREKKEQFRVAVDEALKQAGARNLKAVKALLDLEGITLENGEPKGLLEQLGALKKENGYLFEAGEDNIQFMRPAAKEKAETTREEFQKMGYMQRLKMKKEQPELYETLTSLNRR